MGGRTCYSESKICQWDECKFDADEPSCSQFQVKQDISPIDDVEGVNMTVRIVIQLEFLLPITQDKLYSDYKSRKNSFLDLAGYGYPLCFRNNPIHV